MDFYAWLKDHVTIHDDPNFGNYAPEKKVLVVLDELLGALRKAYDSLASDTKLDDAEVTAAVTKFYDAYFVPIDLPMNDMLERIVEGQLRGFLSTFVEAVAVQIRARNQSNG